MSNEGCDPTIKPLGGSRGCRCPLRRMSRCVGVSTFPDTAKEKPQSGEVVAVGAGQAVR